MAIQEVTSPPLLDTTGQGIVTELQNIVSALSPNAQGVSYSHATSGLSAENVQEGIDEVKGITDNISNSLTKFHYVGDTACRINSSGLINLTSSFGLPSSAYDINVQIIDDTCVPSSAVYWTNGQWYVYVFVAGTGDTIVRKTSADVTARCSWKTP